jgi:hypothetical protein
MLRKSAVFSTPAPRPTTTRYRTLVILDAAKDSPKVVNTSALSARHSGLRKLIDACREFLQRVDERMTSGASPPQ